MKLKSLLYRILAMIISILPLVAWPQTSTISWSSFSGGFSVSVSAKTQLISLSGVPIVSSVSGTETVINSGFLAGLLVLSGTVAVDDMIGIPSNFALNQNYPNPFNPTTTLRFDLPRNTEINISIHDLLGKKVARLASQPMGPGYYSISWNGKNEIGQSVPSGIYIARLVTPGYSKSIKMLLLK